MDWSNSNTSYSIATQNARSFEYLSERLRGDRAFIYSIFKECNGVTYEESDSLNNIFRNLAVVGASGSGTRTITITNTAGVTFCDRSIAIAKGWAVVS